MNKYKDFQYIFSTGIAEAKTKDFDDDIKITAFNMREELDEGDFDKDGYYHWKSKDVFKNSFNFFIYY